MQAQQSMYCIQVSNMACCVHGTFVLGVSEMFQVVHNRKLSDVCVCVSVCVCGGGGGGGACGGVSISGERNTKK